MPQSHGVLFIKKIPFDRLVEGNFRNISLFEKLTIKNFDCQMK